MYLDTHVDTFVQGVPKKNGIQDLGSLTVKIKQFTKNRIRK